MTEVLAVLAYVAGFSMPFGWLVCGVIAWCLWLWEGLDS